MTDAAVADKPKQELAAVAPDVGRGVMAFIPRTPPEIKWVVGMVVESGLAPDSFGGDKKKMAVAIMKGLEIGVPPLTALSNIAIINGRASIWGDLAMALVQRQGVISKIEETEIGTRPGEGSEVKDFDDSYGFEVKIWRKGQDGPYVGRFTVGDAKRAKLWMNPKRPTWMSYPRRMLNIRARIFALRDGFADCLSGMSIREEAEDLPAAPKEVKDDFLEDTPAEPKDVTAESSEIPEPEASEEGEAEETSEPPAESVWTIHAEGEADFAKEFGRLLANVVETAMDVDELLKANEGRLTPHLEELAERRKLELTGSAI